MELIQSLSIPLGIFMLILVTLLAIFGIHETYEEYKFLKIQILRSGSPQEKAYWEKILKRFWLKKIPFVDRFMH